MIKWKSRHNGYYLIGNIGPFCVEVYTVDYKPDSAWLFLCAGIRVFGRRLEAITADAAKVEALGVLRQALRKALGESERPNLPSEKTIAQLTEGILKGRHERSILITYTLQNDYEVEIGEGEQIIALANSTNLAAAMQKAAVIVKSDLGAKDD